MLHGNRRSQDDRRGMNPDHHTPLNLYMLPSPSPRPSPPPVLAIFDSQKSCRITPAMDSAGSSSFILPTSADVISVTTFYILTWLFCALCTIAYAVRVYIRYVCFRKLLFEDYLMIFALALHISEAVLTQLYVQYAYDLEAVGKGDLSKFGVDFFPNSKKAFIAIGTCINITIIGVLIVKLNFLLFFRRLGLHIRGFNIAWWAILVFTVGGAVAQIAMQQFGCFFGEITYIFSGKCTDTNALKHIFFNSIFSAVVDALSDFFIIGLPVTILWRSQISRRKKFILSFVFGLVFVTIAVTIVRGSVFHEIYNNSTSGGKARMQSATFTWFWFYCEFSVAFIIACIVSFRTLFVQRRNEAEKRDQDQRRREQIYRSAIRRGLKARARQFHDSVLDTCKTLEGVSDTDSGPSNRTLPSVPSDLMSFVFDHDSKSKGTMTTSMTDTTKASEDGSSRV